MSVLNDISQNLQIGKAKIVKELVQQAIDEGIPAKDILEEGLMAGITVVGEKFKNYEMFVPDVLIAARAIGWKTSRMTKLSLSVMRLATYEMQYCEDIPFTVSINEAVELSKKFDDEKAPAFINGVLNGIAEELGLKDTADA